MCPVRTEDGNVVDRVAGEPVSRVAAPNSLIPRENTGKTRELQIQNRPLCGDSITNTGTSALHGLLTEQGITGNYQGIASARAAVFRRHYAATLLTCVT